MPNTRWITIFADTENEKLLLKTKKQKSHVQPYFLHKLPEDPEYWRTSGPHDGLHSVRGFLQTRRGEEWLLRRMEEAAEELDGDYPVPESYDDVSFTRY